MKEQIEAEGHVVLEFQKGGALAQVCDDCCRGEAPEQAKQIFQQAVCCAFMTICQAKRNAGAGEMAEPHRP